MPHEKTAKFIVYSTKSFLVFFQPVLPRLEVLRQLRDNFLGRGVGQAAEHAVHVLPVVLLVPGQRRQVLSTCCAVCTAAQTASRETGRSTSSQWHQHVLQGQHEHKTLVYILDEDF